MFVTISSSTKCCNGRFLISNCLLKPHKTRVGNTSVIKNVSQHLAVITGVLIPFGFGNIVVGNCFFILAKMIIANTGMHFIHMSNKKATYCNSWQCHHSWQQVAVCFRVWFDLESLLKNHIGLSCNQSFACSIFHARSKPEQTLQGLRTHLRNHGMRSRLSSRHFSASLIQPSCCQVLSVYPYLLDTKRLLTKVEIYCNLSPPTYLFFILWFILDCIVCLGHWLFILHRAWLISFHFCNGYQL